MQELIEYIAKSLVDNPEEVTVTRIRGARATVFKLRVAEDDKGAVIGRNGRIADATRTLLRVSAALQGERRAILDIV